MSSRNRDGSPIPYALVQVPGSSKRHTHANEEGEFILKLPKHDSYQLKALVDSSLSGESEIFTVDSNRVNSPLILHIALGAWAEEVVVTARSPTGQSSERRIRQQDLKHVAGTGSDALMVIQSFPDVAIGEDSTATPAVRGSFPGDNLLSVWTPSLMKKPMRFDFFDHYQERVIQTATRRIIDLMQDYRSK